MTRQTMKTLRCWLPAVLLIGAVTPGWPAEIPEELRKIRQRLEFVADLAARCDAALRLLGSSGLDDRDCEMFMVEFGQVKHTVEAARDTLKAAADEADRRPGDVALQRQWAGEMQAMHRVEVIKRTGDRMEFLLEADKRPPKKPQGRAPKR